MLSLVAADGRLDVAAGDGLLDGRWHTVSVRVEADAVTLSVTPDGGADNRSTAMKRESDKSGVAESISLEGTQTYNLRVGAGMVGCIKEGPGVRFTKTGTSVNSFAVRWDSCLLPSSCQGRTNLTISNNPSLRAYSSFPFHFFLKTFC